MTSPRDEARERLARVANGELPVSVYPIRTADPADDRLTITVFDALAHAADLRALLSPEEVGGSDQPVAWRCDGCGRLAKDPSADLATMQAAGAVSCCPERKIEPLFAAAAVRLSHTDASKARFEKDYLASRDHSTTV